MGNKSADLEAILAFTQTAEARERVLNLILRSGLPIYGTDPRFPGFILQTSRDGTVLKGHMKNGKFLAEGKPVDNDNEAAAAFQRVRLRSIGVEAELLASRGGAVCAADFGRELGLTERAVQRLRRAGKLFGIKWRGRYLYPRFQVYNGTLLSGLSDVLRVLAEQDRSDFGTFLFFVTPAEALGGKTPLALLRQGRIARVTRHVGAWLFR